MSGLRGGRDIEEGKECVCVQTAEKEVIFRGPHMLIHYHDHFIAVQDLINATLQSPQVRYYRYRQKSWYVVW